MKMNLFNVTITIEKNEGNGFFAMRLIKNHNIEHDLIINQSKHIDYYPFLMYKK